MSEVEKITMDEARELVSDAALWPLVCEFLWNFAPQVHSSWLKGLETPLASADTHLLSSPRVKRAILSSLGVEPCFHTFPADDGSRLLLLDSGTLEAIAKWLGALACADKLRSVTDGKTVRALKAALPGIYPEVFGYTAYFRGLTIEDLGLKIVEGGVGKIGALGARTLLSFLGSLPASLVTRLRLKFPKAYSDESDPIPNPQSSISNLQSPSLNPQFLAKLLKLKFPEAYSLCCS